MKKLFAFSCTLLLVVNYGYCFASSAIYLLDDKLFVYFPGVHQEVHELTDKNDKFMAFYYTDWDNVIEYVAFYQVNKRRYKDNEIDQALLNYISGQGTMGKIITQKLVNKNGLHGGHFVIQFVNSGVTVRKHAAVYYKDGRFFQWEVVGYSGLSKQDAASLFNENVSAFSVK